MTTSEHNSHVPHPAGEHEASNGEGTVTNPRGETLDHPILDGSTEDYSDEGHEQNPRFGQENPELIRRPATGEETPTPDEGA